MNKIYIIRGIIAVYKKYLIKILQIKILLVVFLHMSFVKVGYAQSPIYQNSKVLNSIQLKKNYQRLRLDTLRKNLTNKEISVSQTDLKRVLRQAIYTNNLGQIANWKNRLTPTFHIIQPPQLNNLFQHSGLHIIEQGQLVQSYFNDSYNVINSLSISDQLKVKNIPFDFIFTRQDMSGNPHISRNIVSSSFNKSTFLQGIRKRLKNQLVPSDVFPDYHLLKFMMNGMKNIMKRKMDSMVSSKKQYLSGIFIKQLEGVKGSPDKCISFLSHKLFNKDYINYVDSRKNMLRILQQKLNQGRRVDKILIDSIKQQIEEYNKIKILYENVVELKNKWQKDPLIKKLKKLKSLKEQKFNQLLEHPEGLKHLATSYLPLNGLEKAFLNINLLNIGNHATNLSPLSLQNFQSTGASIELQKNQKYLMLIAGKSKDLNSMFDLQNFQSLFPNDQTVLGLSLGKGGIDENHTHITFMSYNQDHVSSFNTHLPVPENNTVVLGMDNRFSIGQNITINLELSKSAMHYDRASDIDGKNPSAFQKLAELNGSSQNMAAMVMVNGNYNKLGLNGHIKISFIADEYHNPGNIYLPSGTKALSFGARKYFFKKRLMVTTRGNIRRYNFGVYDDGMMQNSFFAFQGRWQFSNGQFISLSYQPAKNNQIAGNDLKNISGVTNRVRIMGSIQQRIFNTFYRNMVSISIAKNKYDWEMNKKVNSNSLTLSSMQSISLLGNLIYLNLSYDHANNTSDIVYFNSTLTSELGYTYKIGKHLNASSGIEYNAVKAWYNQVGIRQSISLNLSDNLQFNLFMDIRKNIREYNTRFYNDLYHGTWSLHYSF